MATNGERDIDFLISQYYGKDKRGRPDFNYTLKHKYERWGNEFRNQVLQERRERKKLVLAGILADHRLSYEQKMECKDIINSLDVSNFPKLTDEQFVTMIVLYVRTHREPYRVHNYRYMLERVDLTPWNYVNFLTHLSNMARKNSYIRPSSADNGYYAPPRTKEDVGYGDYSSNGAYGGEY